MGGQEGAFSAMSTPIRIYASNLHLDAAIVYLLSPRPHNVSKRKENPSADADPITWFQEQRQTTLCGHHRYILEECIESYPVERYRQPPPSNQHVPSEYSPALSFNQNLLPHKRSLPMHHQHGLDAELPSADDENIDDTIDSPEILKKTGLKGSLADEGGILFFICIGKEILCATRDGAHGLLVDNVLDVVNKASQPKPKLKNVAWSDQFEHPRHTDKLALNAYQLPAKQRNRRWIPRHVALRIAADHHLTTEFKSLIDYANDANRVTGYFCELCGIISSTVARPQEVLDHVTSDHNQNEHAHFWCCDVCNVLLYQSRDAVEHYVARKQPEHTTPALPLRQFAGMLRMGKPKKIKNAELWNDMDALYLPEDGTTSGATMYIINIKDRSQVSIDGLLGFLYRLPSNLPLNSRRVTYPRNIDDSRDLIYSLKLSLLHTGFHAYMSFKKAKALAKKFGMFNGLSELWETELGKKSNMNRTTVDLNCTKCGDAPFYGRGTATSMNVREYTASYVPKAPTSYSALKRLTSPQPSTLHSVLKPPTCLETMLDRLRQGLVRK
ncbi:hypothetical protein IQ07DRAFT_658275 [Pyrenochaeta sp. DS3sAY3a]|nr:hypothetical protein IQ07DRAFT_658275 [Pyrenochaeta sp. DS3sAY3a]